MTKQNKTIKGEDKTAMEKIKEETPNIKKITEEIAEKLPTDAKLDAMEKLLAKVEALEAKDIDNQKQLKMLYEVADKGRVVNYESKNAEKKPFKVKLSVFRDGIIVGWRVVKDELVKHPTTGLTMGEVQEFELLILDKDGQTNKVTVNGYPAFSDARYTSRIDAEVVSKSTDFEDNTSFDVKLPDGKIIKLDARFVN